MVPDSAQSFSETTIQLCTKNTQSVKYQSYGSGTPIYYEPQKVIDAYTRMFNQ